MSDLRQAVIKVARDNPETRKHLVPLLRKTAAPVVPPDVQQFMDTLQRSAKLAFPGGTFGWRAEANYGGKPSTLFIQFTTQGKQDWQNGIIHNDPSLTQLWVHNAFTDGGFLPVLKIEMSMGGKVFGPSHRDALKVGWRDKTGTPEQILGYLKAYLLKLKAVYDSVYPKAN